MRRSILFIFITCLFVLGSFAPNRKGQTSSPFSFIQNDTAQERIRATVIKNGIDTMKVEHVISVYYRINGEYKSSGLYQFILCENDSVYLQAGMYRTNGLTRCYSGHIEIKPDSLIRYVYANSDSLSPKSNAGSQLIMDSWHYNFLDKQEKRRYPHTAFYNSGFLQALVPEHSNSTVCDPFMN